MWQMAHIPGSQVGPYLEEGWEPFAVVPAIPSHIYVGEPLPEPIVYLRRRYTTSEELAIYAARDGG